MWVMIDYIISEVSSLWFIICAILYLGIGTFVIVTTTHVEEGGSRAKEIFLGVLNLLLLGVIIFFLQYFLRKYWKIILIVCGVLIAVATVISWLAKESEEEI